MVDLEFMIETRTKGVFMTFVSKSQIRKIMLEFGYKDNCTEHPFQGWLKELKVGSLVSFIDKSTDLFVRKTRIIEVTKNWFEIDYEAGGKNLIARKGFNIFPNGEIKACINLFDPWLDYIGNNWREIEQDEVLETPRDFDVDRERILFHKTLYKKPILEFIGTMLGERAFSPGDAVAFHDSLATGEGTILKIQGKELAIKYETVTFHQEEYRDESTPIGNWFDTFTVTYSSDKTKWSDRQKQIYRLCRHAEENE